MIDLTDRTVIVTGASGGIGKALSSELAKSGTKLVLNARREEPLQEVARECRDLGGKVEIVPGDSAQASVAENAVNKCLEMGNFFGFFHVAGVANPGPFLWELDETQYREVMGASLDAGYQLVRYSLPHLRESGEGICVFFGSGAAKMTIVGLGAYCAAKAAEEHLMRQLAREAPEVVTFAYRPGVVDTPMQKAAREAEGGAAESVRKQFRALKDQDALISPERASDALLTIVTKKSEQYRGKVCSWTDA